MEISPDKQKLIELAHYRMPFGKYKGRYLLDRRRRISYGSSKRVFRMESWVICCRRCTK